MANNGTTLARNDPGSLNIKNCVYISDDFDGYAEDLFTVPKHYENYIGRVLIPVGLIKDRIEKLAGDIFVDMKGGFKELSTVCILKGGYRFFSDLLDQLNALNTTGGRSIQLSIDFIKVIFPSLLNVTYFLFVYYINA